MARNPREVFMFADQPQGAPAPVMYVNAVTDTKLAPYTGEPAITLAQQIVKRDATQAALVSGAEVVPRRVQGQDQVRRRLWAAPGSRRRQGSGRRQRRPPALRLPPPQQATPATDTSGSKRAV